MQACQGREYPRSLGHFGVKNRVLTCKLVKEGNIPGPSVILGSKTEYRHASLSRKGISPVPRSFWGQKQSTDMQACQGREYPRTIGHFGVKKRKLIVKRVNVVNIRSRL